jgi:hypothetical protein
MRRKDVWWPAVPKRERDRAIYAVYTGARSRVVTGCGILQGMLYIASSTNVAYLPVQRRKTG